MKSDRIKFAESAFLKDIAQHQLTIARDDGLYRHLQFRRPGTYCYAFDLVTWPGYLAYSGDMGCYVFSRPEDMFEFFRDTVKIGKPGDKLYINPGYRGEKVQAADRSCPVEEYSADKFQAMIAEDLDEREASAELRRAVKREVMTFADDGHHEAIRAAMEFEFNGRRPFNDFWEVSVKDYSHRFLWCCYAIAWAVRMYDASKEAKAVDVA